MDANRMDPTPNILITRLSHIGDCILTLPMINRLRELTPGSKIVWAIESPTQKLLANHNSVDEFVVVPKGWMKSPANWASLRKQLRSYKFDICIDPQGITKSSMLGWLSGAKVRIGASGQWGRELSTWLNNRLIEPKSTHLADRSLELLAQLPGFEDVDAGNHWYDLPVPDQAAATATRLKKHNQLQQYVVINPGASWPSKRWDTQRFGSVGSYLYRNRFVRSVLTWAGAEEKAMAVEIAKFDSDAFVIAPPTTLPQLAAVIDGDGASMFVGCDTGPLHMAAAVGTPCVGLYGTTRPQDSGAWPYAEPTPHIAVQKWFQSGSCRKRRSAANDAMMDILAADVFKACDQILDLADEEHRKSA